MKKTFQTESVSETADLAARIGKALLNVGGGALIAFKGGLGVGKTSFVRGLAEGLGIDGNEVSSPTFSFMNEYRDGKASLFHFDMYRLEGGCSPALLEDTGFYGCISDSSGITAVEWSEYIEEELPPECIIIEMIYLSENVRRITVTDNEGRINFGD